MRVAVTGGAGFIGSHLIEALIARGDDVVCIEHERASLRWVRDLPTELRTHGISETHALVQAFDGADVVFHLAGLTQARRVSDYYKVNTEGTARVLQAAAQLGSKAPRVVLTSSLAAVGPCHRGRPLSIDSVPRPLSHYGHSKLLAEVMMHAYADRVPGVILRLSSTYGPRERGVLMFFQLVQRGVALTVGGWEREINLLYVGDLVSALLAAGSTTRGVGRTYYVAHPTPISWGDFAEVVATELHRKPMLLSVPKPIARAIALGAEAGAFVRRSAAILNRERLREMTQRSWVCDVARTIQDVGFQPAFPLHRGVQRTAAWYREAGWI